MDFLFLHAKFIRKHDLFYKKCFPIVQNRGFKYYNGQSKDICTTLILLPKHGPHLKSAGNQNTGIDLSFIWILPLHQYIHDTIRYKPEGHTMYIFLTPSQ